MVPQLGQTYINVIMSFRHDCDLLIQRFKDQNINSLQNFLELWHSMEFNSVYDTKYPNHGLEYDFMFDSLQIAKLIMLRENFAGGLFLIYGLYSLQEDLTATVCLELEEFNFILKMLRLKEEQGFVKKKQNQLALIFTDLLEDGAFDFVKFAREYDLEGQHHALMIYNDQYEFTDEESSRIARPKDWVRQFIDQEITKEMKNSEKDYLKLKSKVKAVFPYLNLSLNMVEEDISTTLIKALSQPDSMDDQKPLVDPQQETAHIQLQAETSSIGARRRSLKNRKMKIKYRYQEHCSEDSDNSHSPPPKKIIKAGAPKSFKKTFLQEVINDPDMSVSSDNEDEEQKFDSNI